MSNTALYRHFDDSGNLLYVGISNSAVRRLGQHMYGSQWASLISKVEIEHLSSRQEALAAEKAAIRAEMPAWNKMHNDRDCQGPIVRSSADLLMAHQGVGLRGKRLLAMCMLRDNLGEEVVVDAAELSQSFPRYRDDRAIYRDLRLGAEELNRAYATLPCGTTIKWSESRYSEGEASLFLSEEILSHMRSEGRQVSYPLRLVAPLSSTYSWRVLEIAKSSRRVSLEGFRNAVGAPRSCRNSFKDLRKRIIEPAIRDLRSRGLVTISWDPKKRGRSVSTLHFSVR